ncbi:hypothetical protein KKE45_02425 [Patescibacteria group bacterium]|nr:hypothetical protein [Patescibacteria group bacterium]
MVRVEYRDKKVTVVGVDGETQMVLNNVELKRRQLPPEERRGRRRMRWLNGSFLNKEDVDTEIYCRRMDIA